MSLTMLASKRKVLQGLNVYECLKLSNCVVKSVFHCLHLMILLLAAYNDVNDKSLKYLHESKLKVLDVRFCTKLTKQNVLNLVNGLH